MSRDLILIAFSLMTWGIGEGMFLAFQTPYLEQMGADSLQIGRILGLVGMAMAITHLPAGFLSDRMGRRPLLLTAWGIGAVATWAMALAPNLPLFVTGAILYGFTAFVMTPLNSYITTARGNQSVARVLTLISAAYNVGAIAGPWLGGIIGERFSLRANFIAGAAIFIISTTIISFIRPQQVLSAPQPVRQVSRDFLGNKKFLIFLVLYFLVMFGMYLPQPFSQLYLINQQGVDLSNLGRLVSITSLGVVVINLLLGRLNPRIGFACAQISMALFALLLWRGNSMLMFSAGYFLLGSYRTARLLASAQGGELIEAKNTGMAYGLIESAHALAVILAPILASYLYAYQPVSIYSISLLLILLGLVIIYFFSPLRRQNNCDTGLAES